MRTKFFYLILLMVVIPCTMTAQEKNDVINEKVMRSLELNDSIFIQLKAIRELQEKARDKREEIRKKHEKELVEQSEADMSNEYGAILQVENNTHPHWYLDGWNLFGIVTCIIAVLSAYFAIVTYRAQKKTEKHTTNAPLDVQLRILDDLPRHFYRNLVCSCAIVLKYKYDNKGKKYYPSESNMLKLQTLPEDVVLPIDIDTAKKNNPYQYMHELKLLLRNYNLEVETASKHLAQKGITDESLNQDFDNILFKPLFLIRRSYDYWASLQENRLKTRFLRKRIHIEGRKIVEDTIMKLMQEHFKKLSESSNFKTLFDTSTTDYYKYVLQEEEMGFNDNNESKTINRSISFLLTYKRDSDKDMVSKISSKEIVERFKTIPDGFLRGKEAQKDKPAYPGILAINNSDDFVKFCIGRGFVNDNEEGAEKAKTLYGHISNYLNYLKEETWDVPTIIKCVLSIDAAIETNRIGMVNYV